MISFLDDLGMCCACRVENDSVRNILTPALQRTHEGASLTSCFARQDVAPSGASVLDTKAPIEGTGWGGALCALPADGALAVLCDECFQAGRPLYWIVEGFLNQKERIAVADAPSIPFVHNPARHAWVERALDELRQAIAFPSFSQN